MPRKTIESAWKSLKAKVKEFEEFANCPVICITFLQNSYLYEGSTSLKAGFASQEEVVGKFNAALSLQTLPFEDNNEEEDVQPTFDEVLTNHVFDLDVVTMRAILTSVVVPKNALTNKDKRKNLYREENAPLWWRETGLPFKSVNHKSENSQFKQMDLWRLLEALQYFRGIIPSPPRRKPKTDIFISRFYQESDASTSVAGSVSVSAEGSVFAAESVPSSSGPVHEPFVGLEEESAAQRKEWIMNLSLERVQEAPRLVSSKLLAAESWAELTELCVPLLGLVNNYQEVPSIQWRKAEITDNSYAPFIPNTLPKNYRLLETSADGNCLFNSVSTLLTGGEDASYFYRLIVVIDMVDRLREFAKYILLEFNENWREWLQMVTDDPSFVNAEVEPMEIIQNVCRNEIRETLKSFHRDCSILHIHFLAHFLHRPIQLHCAVGEDVYRSYGFLQKLYLPPFDTTNRVSFHLVWLPSNPAESQTISHIVPAVAEIGSYSVPKDHCPLLAINSCIFQQGANENHIQDMVQCIRCSQSFHCLCVHEDFGNESFCCGCINPLSLQLKNLASYSSHVIVDKLKEMDIGSLIKDAMTWPSLRKFIYIERPQYSPALKFQLRLRMGPFVNDDVIHEIMMIIRAAASADLHQLVPDLLLKEVLLLLIQKEEGITRAPAEFVLCRQFQT